MGISYIEPAERAWARTRGLLLRTVDVESWLVIGFASFLAGLAGRWAGLSFTPHWRFGYPPDFGNLIEAPFESPLETFRGSAGFLFGLPIALALLVLGVVLLWLSSRGKLIFLDNMVRQRAAVIEPWKELGTLAGSLFRWRLGFWVGVMLVAGVVLSPLFWLGRNMNGTGLGQPFGTLVTYAAAAGSVVFALAVGYVLLFLENFVVPLMYHRRIAASEAWRQFLPLLRANAPEFLAYGLVVSIGVVAVFLGLIAAAILTCCVLPLLLSVPYLHSVLLLPLTGFYRLYSLEFLGQYGPEFRFLGEEETPTSAPD